MEVAGQSRVLSGFGGAGAVSFYFVANGATVYSPETADRAAVLEALGRAIGRTAVHEFAHLLAAKTPIHDTRDANSYENGTSSAAQYSARCTGTSHGPSWNSDSSGDRNRWVALTFIERAVLPGSGRVVAAVLAGGALRRRGGRLLRRLAPLPEPGTKTMLELGSGGGSFASHLKHRFRLTLTDHRRACSSRAARSIRSRAHRRRHAHAAPQSRVRLRAGARCGVLHDDATRPAGAIDTAAVHCKRGGTIMFLPDFVEETFTRARRRVARTRRTAEASAISHGRGIPIRATPPIWSTTRSCFERRTVTCAPSTIGTSKACSRARPG